MRPFNPGTFWAKRSNETNCYLRALLLKSANGEECIQELSDFNDSVYRQEFTVEKLEKQLGILVDVIHVELPEVKKVTSVRSICDAMAKHANRN